MTKTEYNKQYRLKNREKLNAYLREYYIINKDKAIAVAKSSYYKNKNHVLEQHKDYRKRNKEVLKDKARIYTQRKRDTDLNFRLVTNLRTRLYRAIKNEVKSGSSVKDLGCSIEEFKVYLESKFLPGMTWINWNRTGWHIDHIIPLTAFDLTDRNELLKACNYTNLQPLWAKINISKGGNRG